MWGLWEESGRGSASIGYLLRIQNRAGAIGRPFTTPRCQRPDRPTLRGDRRNVVVQVEGAARTEVIVVTLSRYGAGLRLILSEMSRKNRYFRDLAFAKSVLSSFEREEIPGHRGRSAVRWKTSSRPLTPRL